MRLTQILCKVRPEFHGYIPKFKGKITIGKDRYVPRIYIEDKIEAFKSMIVEQQVLNVLEKPYITEEQEIRFLQMKGRSRPEYYDDYLHLKTKKPLMNKYACDILRDVDKGRTWDEEY